MSLFGSFWKKDSRKTQKPVSSGRWRVGDKIANRFEIYQILGGEGKTGMGIVYVCYDHQHEILYALKTFQGQYLFSEEGIKLFEREAIVWTELERYFYIVRAYWVERLEGRLFIVLEYITPDAQGRNNLTHYIGNLVYPEILKFSIQFCYGMEYAYSKGIDCHRDIKPDNIMITADKTAKITDFGLAKAFQEIEIGKDIISQSERADLSIFQTKGGKRACGTLQYMAPEQFDGYADKRSDIYSFGVVLYQLVTEGRLPFIGRTQEEYERLHRNERITQLSSQLFPIIQKCLEKEPDKRYQDFVSIREELQKLLLRETGEKITLFRPEELDAKGWNNKGIALTNLGRHQEALICYDKAIETDARLALAWNNKGATLDNLSRYQEAISCFDEALRIDPRCAEAWNNMGLVLDNLGRSQEAISCYDEAIKLTQKYANAWSNKGAALYNLGRYQEAINCYGEALRIDPRDKLAQNNKKLCHKKLGWKF